MNNEQAFEELRDSLWYQLACRCEQCSDELDLSEFNRVKERDAVAWSRVAAEKAFELGWKSAEKSPTVYCPACAEKIRQAPAS